MLSPTSPPPPLTLAPSTTPAPALVPAPVPPPRHDICQKVYTTGVFGAKILPKKRVNRDNGKFTTKQRKSFKSTNLRQKRGNYPNITHNYPNITHTWVMIYPNMCKIG